MAEAYKEYAGKVRAIDTREADHAGHQHNHQRVRTRRNTPPTPATKSPCRWRPSRHRPERIPGSTNCLRSKKSQPKIRTERDMLRVILCHTVQQAVPHFGGNREGRRERTPAGGRRTSPRRERERVRSPTTRTIPRTRIPTTTATACGPAATAISASRRNWSAWQTASSLSETPKGKMIKVPHREAQRRGSGVHRKQGECSRPPAIRMTTRRL